MSFLIKYLHLVLHPQHKLEYFRHAGWTSAWIDTAEALVRDEFERSYMSASSSDSGGESNEGEDDLNEDDSDGAQDKVCHDNFLPFHSLIINYSSLITSLTISLP